MSHRKVLIFDTSVMCCWLQIPEKDTCGPAHDQWDFQRISDLVEEETNNGSIFVLPVATIIETGNHIAQSKGDRYDIASVLSEKLRAAAEERTPWAAFENQNKLWEPESLINMCKKWPTEAIQGLGIGDVTIKNVAEYYASIGSFEVQILTGDEGLKAYEPAKPALIPRRRRD